MRENLHRLRDLETSPEVFSTTCAAPTYTIGLAFRKSFLHEILTPYRSAKVSCSIMVLLLEHNIIVQCNVCVQMLGFYHFQHLVCVFVGICVATKVFIGNLPAIGKARVGHHKVG